MATEAQLTLVFLEGPDAGRRVPYAGERLVIGRTTACNVVLKDPTSSRQHAAIELSPSGFALVDLGSANGTFVEGEKARITRHALTDGDEIVIGRTRIRVEMPFEPDATMVAVAAPGPEVAPPRPKGAAPASQSDAQAAAVAASKAGDVGVQPPSDLPIVLTVMTGPDRGMVYSPSSEVITIGRVTTSDVALSDPACSRLHASIKREHGGYAIYDENSRNGLEVGSPPKRVAQADLKHGDTIRIGSTEIRVDIGAGKGETADDLDRTVLSGTVGSKTFTMSIRGLGSRVRAQQSAGEEDATALAVALPMGPRIVLRVTAGPDKGGVFEPAAGFGKLTVGRGSRATYRVADPGVSSLQFTITEANGEFLLTDDSSRNGTFVNEGPTRVTSVILKDGNRIKIGSSELRVEVLAADEAPAEPSDATIVAPAGGAPAPAAAGAPGPAAGAPASDAVAKSGTKAERATPKAEDRAKKKPQELVPELARSAAAKERISKIMKGVSLRPIRRPGTPRVWLGLGLMLLAVLVSTGFGYRAPALLSAGPLFKDHADLEAKCETCHAGGVQQLVDHTSMDRSCIAADCHASVLENEPGQRDDCISCHTDHRGRDFPIVGGPDVCWDCHRQDYTNRIMTVVVTGDLDARARLAEIAITHPTEIGLKFSHTQHDQDSNGDATCDTCHPKIDDGRTFALPGHAECIDCHDKVVSKNYDEARAKKGPDCLECHTREDGALAKPPPIVHTWVIFSHADHTADDCKKCHAGIWTEGPYASVIRTAELYPVPMDACFTCHQQRDATLACLDCHRSHHSFDVEQLAAAPANAGGLGFNGFMLGMLALVLGAMGYTFADMRFARRWLEPEPPPPPAVAPAGKGGDGAAAGGAAPAAEVMPFPKVDVEACISCSSCYNSCPKEVLKGDDHGKSTVVNPNSCIALEGCRVCEQGCPTGAIRVTTAPLLRTVERPDIDEFNQAKIPGLFFVGEVIGAALIKSAINQGHQTITYIADKRPKVANATYDVIIVGAGPGGLGAGLEAKKRGLKYLVVERDTIASTIKNYPRDKAVLAEPIKVPLYGQLPMMDADKDTLISVWETIVKNTGLEVHEHEDVTDVKRNGDLFTVKTSKGEYQGANVILAIGTRGNPRKLGCAGETPERVHYNLIDAGEHKGQAVLVVGGGDSAIEAAVALGQQPGTKCVLSYRKTEFSRVKKRNQETLDEVVKAGGVELALGSTVHELGAATAKLKAGDAIREVPCVHVFALIGADPPRAWIESIGVAFVTREEEVVSWG